MSNNGLDDRLNAIESRLLELEGDHSSISAPDVNIKGEIPDSQPPPSLRAQFRELEEKVDGLTSALQVGGAIWPHWYMLATS